MVGLKRCKSAIDSLELAYEFLIFWRWRLDYKGILLLVLLWASQVALVVRNQPTGAGDIRDMGSIPGMGRSPGEGNGNPLQYSCLETPLDRGAWRATVHGLQRARHDWNDLACTHHLLSYVWFFATPYAVACQAPWPMGLSGQEYWDG